MEQKIAVKLEYIPKVFLFDLPKFKVNIGNMVVIETSRGQELGKIIKDNVLVENSDEDKFTQNQIIRIANESDIKVYKENKILAQEYIKKTKILVQKFKLDMKIIGAELTLNKSKIIISFTADNRVDFRQLVKELANEFKIKIELRQVGPRDEVQILGSVGVCGRECCCHKNTNDFEHVSIKMAKIQGLSLNPSNISGVCGKLMCCLAYENQQYADIFNKMPRINSEVKTPDGIGRVVYNNIIKKQVQVKVNDEFKEFGLDEIIVYKSNALGKND